MCEIVKIEFNQLESLQLLPKKIAVITDHTVEKLYGDRLVANLQAQRKEVCVFSFPPGEQHKNRTTKENIENSMMQNGCGRDCLVIGFGGGVVTDLAGFIAATYCRGVPLVLIPTTLTAMVDASIGGKTGVNSPFGKNLIGSFYLPQQTLVDLSFLSTLPLQELKNGIIEMLKHGLIADKRYFNFLVEHAVSIIELQQHALTSAVTRAIEIKQRIVKQDPHEKGKRRLLNFGHTVGHAIEQHLKYAISHGEAVTLGILAESQLSTSLGLLSKKNNEQIREALKQFQFTFKLNHKLEPAALISAMGLDKKGLEGNPRFVLLETIGKAKKCDGHYCEAVDKPTLLRTLQWLEDVVRSH